jgi:hypothetical protein
MNGDVAVESTEIEPLPALTRKRVRSVAWRATAPEEQTEYIPFEVCLLPHQTIDNVFEEIGKIHGHTHVATFTTDQWQSLSAMFRVYVRQHSLYPVVVKSNLAPSKKCAQAAIRRLEIILAWFFELQVRYADQPKVVDEIVMRQTNYGKSRQRGRIPRKTEPALVSCPVAPPRDLNLLLLTHDCPAALAVSMGMARTLRVYDITGKCVWLVPVSTLVQIGVYSATPELVAADEPTLPEFVTAGAAEYDTIVSTDDVFACL